MKPYKNTYPTEQQISKAIKKHSFASKKALATHFKVPYHSFLNYLDVIGLELQLYNYRNNGNRVKNKYPAKEIILQDFENNLSIADMARKHKVNYNSLMTHIRRSLKIAKNKGRGDKPKYPYPSKEQILKDLEFFNSLKKLSIYYNIPYQPLYYYCQRLGIMKTRKPNIEKIRNIDHTPIPIIQDKIPTHLQNMTPAKMAELIYQERQQLAA